MLLEFFSIFFISIWNLFYNIFQKIKDFFLFFPDFRFFFLDLILYFLYIRTSPFSLRYFEGKNLPVTYDELTYGEIYYFTARNILKNINFSSEDLLIDLGSGRGKMVFFASIYYGARAIGLDIMPTFVKKSSLVASKLKLKKVEFLEQDFRNYDFSKSTVIYLAGTCLSDESISLLLKSLKSAPVGAKIISLSYPLRSDFLNVISKNKMSFSWGSSMVYVHEKLSIEK